MTWDRKRTSQIIAGTEEVEQTWAAVESSSHGGQGLLEAIGKKLSSGDKEEVIKAFSLLSCAEVPLEVILVRENIFTRLVEALGVGDLELAAEAANVFRTWCIDQDRSVRLLYAHCLFPDILSQFSRAIKILEDGFTEMGKEQIRLFEHWINSLVLVTWSIIEEIPASLSQLNNSVFGYMSVLMLEKEGLLQDETVTILLRCLLCAAEENWGVFSQTDTARLYKCLETLGEASQSVHMVLLAYALHRTFSFISINAKDIFFLDNLLTKTSCTEGSLSYLGDLLEILANYLSEVSVYDQSECLIATLILKIQELVPLVHSDDPKDVGHKCLQRALSCILNVMVSDFVRFDRGMVESIWDLSCNLLAFTLISDEVLAVLAKLMRNLVTTFYQESWHPQCRDNFERIVSDICTRHINNDEIISSLVSIPAVVLGDHIDDEWHQQMVKELFKPGRSVETIVSVAEIVEKLETRNSINISLRELLRHNMMAVINSCSQDVEENYQDELAYINSIFKPILE